MFRNIFAVVVFPFELLFYKMGNPMGVSPYLDFWKAFDIVLYQSSLAKVKWHVIDGVVFQ